MKLCKLQLQLKKENIVQNSKLYGGNLSVHYIKGKGITEYDDNGNVINMMGVNLDVTSEKKRTAS
jgi:hypothetical protein